MRNLILTFVLSWFMVVAPSLAQDDAWKPFKYDQVPPEKSDVPIVVAVLMASNGKDYAAAVEKGGEMRSAAVLRASLGPAMADVLRGYGYEVLGPYRTADEIGIVERRRIQLIIAPEYQIYPDWSGTRISYDELTSAQFVYGAAAADWVKGKVEGTCGQKGFVTFGLFTPDMQRIDTWFMGATKRKVDCTFKTKEEFKRPEIENLVRITLDQEYLLPVYRSAFLEIMDAATVVGAPALLKEYLEALAPPVPGAPPPPSEFLTRVKAVIAAVKEGAPEEPIPRSAVVSVAYLYDLLDQPLVDSATLVADVRAVAGLLEKRVGLTSLVERAQAGRSLDASGSLKDWVQRGSATSKK